MDSLPNELKDIILNLLDGKTIRYARLACTDWFKRMRCTQFEIYFANSDLLPQIESRLAIYQYPIDLKFIKPVNTSKTEIILHVSKLTQLRSLIIKNKSFTYKDTALYYDYLELRQLSNLEELDIDFWSGSAEELWQYFPKLKRTGVRMQELVAKNCKNLEFCIVRTGDLNEVPETALIVDQQHRGKVVDSFFEDLARFTRLRSIDFNNSLGTVNVTNITWLENLKVDFEDAIGLEHCRQLTSLHIAYFKHKNAGTLLNRLSSLSALKKLIFFAHSSHVLLPDLSNLKSLQLTCLKADLNTLGTSLEELSLHHLQQYDISEITRLDRLTKLELSNCPAIDFSPLNSISKLIELKIISIAESTTADLQYLTNLTSLVMSAKKLKDQHLTNLTNLQHFDARHLPIEYATWEGLERMSNLTALLVNEYNASFPMGCNFGFNIIAQLPLRLLSVDLISEEDFWTVVTSLTTLEALEVKSIHNGDHIMDLTSLDRLTRLFMDCYADAVHKMTVLTNLQIIGLDPQALHIVEPNRYSLASKLTRLLKLTDF